LYVCYVSALTAVTGKPIWTTPSETRVHDDEKYMGSTHGDKYTRSPLARHVFGRERYKGGERYQASHHRFPKRRRNAGDEFKAWHKRSLRRKTETINSVERRPQEGKKGIKVKRQGRKKEKRRLEGRKEKGGKKK
jgi:hypothetical protein